jgi:ABC-2 type transport system permease protein
MTTHPPPITHAPHAPLSHAPHAGLSHAPHAPLLHAPQAGLSARQLAWRGFLALAGRETRRFLKVWAQTLGAPVVTTLLFLAIFVLALGETKKEIGGIPYLDFLGAGLVVMAMAQNAFANSSSSIVIMKVQGNIVDIVMAPLPPWALLGGLVAGAALRGLAVAAAVLLAMWPIVHFPLPDPLAAFAFAALGSAMMAILGVLAGLWAQKFDQLATITNFVVTPLAFLSGTFYSVARLPEPVLTIAHADPLFWMIDGVRYGLAGHAEGDARLGLLGLALVTAALWAWALSLVRKGWRLRA